MSKLKNIGISALAGTLVSLSAAQAGGVSVSGVYEVSYTQLDDSKTAGNKLGIKKNISFGAGGDLSDGGGVTWSTNIGWTDGADLSSASLALNMGGIATLTYDSGGGGTGANAIDNIVPTAWEEVDYGFSTGISDVGAVSASKGVINLTVKAPVAGSGFSISYASGMAGGHTSDGTVAGSDGYRGVDLVVDFVDYDAAHAGFRFGLAAQLELPEVTCKNLQRDQATWSNFNSCGDGHKAEPYAGSIYQKLQLGPLHLGIQGTFKSPELNKASAVKNQRSIVGGAALVFGDTLSVSYGVAKDKYRYNNRNRAATMQAGTQCGGNESYCAGDESNEYVTQKYSGWSAALNLGPVALKGTHNRVKGDKKSSIYASEVKHSELNLSIAF
jgi:hypothetical protein